ncbi:MAG TPA: hypothetical protein VGD50_08450 [Candidatus Baltobacteraceae bacterium]
MRLFSSSHRLGVTLALALVVVLTGCKEPAGSNVQSSVVRGTQDVVVNSVTQYIDPNDAKQVFYVCQITWTNSAGPDLIPRIERFILTDASENQYPGLDTGAVALIGINNYRGVVKKGETHSFTVGFHVPFNTVGTIFYDQT